MTAPDITASAIEAGLSAVDTPEMGFQATKCNINERDVRTILEAAVPVLLDSHEKQVRERIAREIKAATGLWCPTCGCHVHIRHEGKRHCINDHEWDVSGIMNAHEAIAIARGSRLAADGGGGESV